MFVDRGIPDGETTAYRAHVGERPLGEGRLTVNAEDGGYRQAVEGRLGDILDYRSETLFGCEDGNVYAISSRFETLDGDTRVALELGTFPGVNALTFGGAIGGYPPDIVPWIGVPLALRGVELEAGTKFRFPIWLGNTVFWEVAGRVGPTERAVVPAGAFEAWRITVRVNFHAISAPLDRLVRAAVRPFRFHFDAEAPHRMLRFEFPTGPFPWNPRGLVEATEIS